MEGEDDRQGVLAIGICSTCLDAGRDGAIEPILDNVAELRDQATGLEELAEAIRTMQPRNWATTSELNRAHARAGEKIRMNSSALADIDTWCKTVVGLFPQVSNIHSRN